MFERGDKQGTISGSGSGAAMGWGEEEWGEPLEGEGEEAATYCELLCELAEVYSRYEVQPPAGVTAASLLQTALEIATSLRPAGWVIGGVGAGAAGAASPRDISEHVHALAALAAPVPEEEPEKVLEVVVEVSAAGLAPIGEGAVATSSGCPGCPPNLLLAQVLHRSAWALLDEKGVADPVDARTVESHFSRAIQLRGRARGGDSSRGCSDALAAESYNGLGQLYHMQARGATDPAAAATLWSTAEATLTAALEQHKARPLSTELGQSLTALGTPRLNGQPATHAPSLQPHAPNSPQPRAR